MAKDIRMKPKEKLVKFVAENPNLEKLEELLQEFNVFETLDIERKEIRHSNFLAWILNPKANHALLDYFLKKVLLRICKNAKELGIDVLSIVDLDTWDLSGTVVERERSGIDILIRNDDERKKFVVAIENKVYSPEVEGQLSKYRGIVESEFRDFKRQFVFLTREGDRPGNEEEASFWVPLSYSEVCEIIEQMLKARSFISENIKMSIGQYAQMLRRHILRESEVQELARKIYGAHKDAIDLIFEHRPDRQSEIKALLQDMIEKDSSLKADKSSKMYISFISKSLDLKTPRIAEGWTESKRILLFQFKNEPSKLALYLVVGPSPDKGTRSKLIDLAKSDIKTFNIAKRKAGPEWFSIYKKQFLYENDFEDFDLDTVKGKIEKKFKDFKSDLVKIEEVFRKEFK